MELSGSRQWIQEDDEPPDRGSRGRDDQAHEKGKEMFGYVYSQINQSQRSRQVRMGKGKGAPDHYVAVIKAGVIMFEMEGVPYKTAVERLLHWQHRNCQY